MRQRLLVSALLAGCALVGTGLGAYHVQASDHDDGPQGVSQKPLGLTDLYVFREQDQNPSATGDNLIFIMNTHPRSVSSMQFYYDTNAQYEFHVSRVDSNTAQVTGKDDAVMRFTFGEPNASTNRQEMTMTLMRDGQNMMVNKTADGQAMTTTPIGAQPINNQIMVDNKPVTVFAGMREDPFFFDVERFFEVRASAAARAAGDTSKPQVTFRENGEDFTEGLNVSSIVVRVPRSLLQGSSNATTFDVWEIVNAKK